MRLRVILLLTVGIAACSATAEPYWYSYEAKDGKLPEESGWTRYWGNWEGEYQGPGATRTFENGALNYDSLYDTGVYDMNLIRRPGAIDPRGGDELFAIEWRLLVERVVGRTDPAIGVFSDHARIISFEFAADRITSAFDSTLDVPIEPGVFHNYRMASSDMLTYTLYVDGALAHAGALWQGLTMSEMAWGDSVKGAASSHTWSYVRFGVTTVPEPTSLALLCVVLTRSRCLLRH